MSNRRLLAGFMGLSVGLVCADGARAKNVAVIDSESGLPSTDGEEWCQFLVQHGHTCIVFPRSGPTSPLDPFDVVIDMSDLWSDPEGTLSDAMHAGKTIVVRGGAAYALGIDSDAGVQAWIGANMFNSASDKLVSVASDPILGNDPPGTVVVDCFNSECASIDDTTGHSGAKVLARFTYSDGSIGLMRNSWEGGLSVFLSSVFHPTFVESSPLDRTILNAVNAPEPIPTLNDWALIVLAIGFSGVGAAILRRRISKAATLLAAVLFTHLAPPPHLVPSYA